MDGLEQVQINEAVIVQIKALSVQMNAACHAIANLAELIWRINPSVAGEVKTIAAELRREIASAMLVLGDLIVDDPE